MTIYERVRELDRLYLLHDKLSQLYLNAIGTSDEDRLRRQARAAWKRYTDLRDSRIGLPLIRAGAAAIPPKGGR